MARPPVAPGMNHRRPFGPGRFRARAGTPAYTITADALSLWTVYYGADGGGPNPNNAARVAAWDGEMPVGRAPLRLPDPIPFLRT